jgi:NAD dependent epimerase/dehydratase family enzyme
VLERPAVLAVPAFALELLYGEMARATLLAGQRVIPTALTSAGFQFQEPTLERALRRVLNRAV